MRLKPCKRTGSCLKDARRLHPDDVQNSAVAGKLDRALFDRHLRSIGCLNASKTTTQQIRTDFERQGGGIHAGSS